MASPLHVPLRTPVRSALRLARETLYLSVGAGVLAVQAAQVRRRELERELSERFGTRATPTGGVVDPAS